MLDIRWNSDLIRYLNIRNLKHLLSGKPLSILCVQEGTGSHHNDTLNNTETKTQKKTNRINPKHCYLNCKSTIQELSLFMREGPGYQFHRWFSENPLTFQKWRGRGTSKEINVFLINFKPFSTCCSLKSNAEWDINFSPNRESNSSNDDIVKNKVWKCPNRWGDCGNGAEPPIWLGYSGTGNRALSIGLLYCLFFVFLALWPHFVRAAQCGS